MRSSRFLLPALLVAGLALSACSPAAPEPEPSPSATPEATAEPDWSDPGQRILDVMPVIPEEDANSITYSGLDRPTVSPRGGVEYDAHRLARVSHVMTSWDWNDPGEGPRYELLTVVVLFDDQVDLDVLIGHLRDESSGPYVREPSSSATPRYEYVPATPASHWPEGAVQMQRTATWPAGAREESWWVRVVIAPFYLELLGTIRGEAEAYLEQASREALEAAVQEHTVPFIERLEQLRDSYRAER